MESRLAQRYAESILELAEENSHLDRVYQDAIFLMNTIRDSRDLQRILASPIVKTEKKLKVLRAIFGTHLSDLYMRFIDLITRKNRENHLADISKEIVNLYKKKFNILTAEVITAVPLTEDLREKVRDKVAHLGKSVELIEKVEPDVLGGFLIRVADRQLDRTIARQLADIRIEFSKNPIFS